MGKCPFFALLLLICEGCYALLGFQPLRSFSAPAESLVHAAPILKQRVGGSSGVATVSGHVGNVVEGTLSHLRNKPQFQWLPVGGKKKKQVGSKEDRNKPTEPSPEEGKWDPLPWQQSIDPQRDLSYMEMFKSHLDLMQQMGMQQLPLEDKFANRESAVKPARIGNLLFQNDQFRKVRMTYFDAGDSVQVFNAVWYPRYEYDLPMLGIDLISLGKNRVLSVIDLQPLHPTVEYSLKYIEQLNSIRDKYEDLQGTLSGKFYDDTSFFSKNMLFGRFTDESKLIPVVAPALDDYLKAYISTMATAVPNYDPAAMAVVKERQTAYDQYSALKDPAVGLFDAYFGKEWSSDFVHDFLFTLSDAEETTKQRELSKAANIGAGKPAAGGGGNPNPYAPTGKAATAAVPKNGGVSQRAHQQPVHQFRIDPNTGEVTSQRKADPVV